MKDQRSRWRGAATQIGLFLMVAAGLGLVAPLPAIAGCAGPQVTLEQGGAPVPARRVGEAETETLLYDITRKQPLRVSGTNLTFDCQDTHSTTRRGCGAPVPEPVEPIVPLLNAEIVLTQRDRSWTLADIGTIGPDLSTVLDVRLPQGLRPGTATLSLVDRLERNGPKLELVVS